jgi:hypothetical protein
MEPPVIDSHQCRFGEWLYSEAMKSLDIGQGKLDAIITSHETIHLKAKELIAAKKNNEIEKVGVLIVKIDEQRDVLISYLRELITNDY